jgi:hypothetical protein
MVKTGPEKAAACLSSAVYPRSAVHENPAAAKAAAEAEKPGYYSAIPQLTASTRYKMGVEKALFPRYGNSA